MLAHGHRPDTLSKLRFISEPGVDINVTGSECSSANRYPVNVRKEMFTLSAHTKVLVF